VTNDDVLNGLARKIAEERSTARAGVRATEQARERSAHRAPRPSMPLAGFELVEVMARTFDHVVGQPLGSVSWPEQWRVVAVGNGRFIEAARADRVLTESDRVLALTPLPADRPLPTNHRVGL
jgi:hypothetical protein